MMFKRTVEIVSAAGKLVDNCEIGRENKNQFLTKDMCICKIYDPLPPLSRMKMPALVRPNAVLVFLHIELSLSTSSRKQEGNGPLGERAESHATMGQPFWTICSLLRLKSQLCHQISINVPLHTN